MASEMRDVEQRIHEALLSIIHDISPNRVTVSSLCRRAGVSRSTFYTHYGSLEDVYEHLLEEALRDCSEGPYRCTTCDGGYNCPYGICDRVLSHPEYGPLFFEEFLSGMVVRKVTEIHKDRYVREVVREYDITPNQAAAIFDFQLNGCLAVNRAAYRRSTFCVEDNRDTIGEFIRSGLSNFGTRDGQKG